MSDLIRSITEPLGMLWFLLLAWTVWRLARRRWRQACASGFVVLAVSLIGNNWVAGRLLAGLERPYAGRSADSLAPADAVVMLGGTVSLSPNDVLGFNLASSADRFVTAVELARRGKGKVLILGGAPQGSGAGARHEGEILLGWLKAWNIAACPAIVLEGCRTTYDEARTTQRVLQERGWQRVILVTSAAHMRRGEAIFRKLGIEVDCIATDFRALANAAGGAPFNPVPNVDALGALSLYAHEVIGWYVYRWRGRL